MGTAADAFGAYRHDMHEGKNPGIGMGSEFLDSSLSFWKDRYFVSLIALDETEEVAQALLMLVKSIAEAVPGNEGFPDMVKLIPKEGKAFERAHYFHNKSLLDRHYFIAEENLLDLDENTEGLLIRCESETPTGKKEKTLPSVLLVIRYGTREKAFSAHKRFTGSYLGEAGQDNMVLKKTGRWAGARCKGHFLIAILDATSQASGTKRIETVLNAVSKEYERGALHEEK